MTDKSCSSEQELCSSCTDKILATVSLLHSTALSNRFPFPIIILIIVIIIIILTIVSLSFLLLVSFSTYLLQLVVSADLYQPPSLLHSHHHHHPHLLLLPGSCPSYARQTHSLPGSPVFWPSKVHCPAFGCTDLDCTALYFTTLHCTACYCI